MITQTDLNISNISYTNKDFQSIITELYEYAKKLSSLWDPSSTNESDAGVILLKLLAFIGDKNNYNIDENILQAFMPSVSQISQMRQLCEMNAFQMSSYVSAIAPISIVYKGDDLGEDESFVLPKFTTQLSDINNTVTFSLLNDAVIRGGQVVNSDIKAIQGKAYQLTVGNSTIIQLSNLDDNNRLYLPSKNVAENGIFVYNADNSTSLNEPWEQVTNLNITGLSDKSYKFGYNSTLNLPYIEFPENITTTIGTGLVVWYILSDGVQGNIASNVLYKVASPTKFKVDNTEKEIDVSLNEDGISKLSVTNTSSTSSGADPNTINEAYNKFKKVAGTFSTLVTCRDYANALYNKISSQTSKNLVSNVQVSDRRDDINFSRNIITLNRDGIAKISLNDYTNITPFDLMVYALNPIVSDYNIQSYKNSYQPASYQVLLEAKASLEENQTISHTLKDLINDFPTSADGRIFLLKNMYTLNGKIITNSKVNKFEQQTILTNIKTALVKNFNSRELEYGYEIPFDSLIDIIKNSDSRIKTVSLEEPIINTNVVVKDSKNTNGFRIIKDFVGTDASGNNYYIDIIAKNVLEGKVNLFNTDETFSYDYGQSIYSVSNDDETTSIGPELNSLIKLDTEVLVDSQDIVSADGYTLNKNEVIQLVAPNLTTELTYTYGTNYLFNSQSTTEIGKDVEYELAPGETLKLNYTDSNEIEHNITYTQGDIIKTNFALVAGNPTSGGVTIGAEKYYQLTAQQTIQKRNVASTDIKFNGVIPNQLPCYWLRNNEGNVLFLESDFDKATNSYETILNANEYFIYTNPSKTELVILGSGTKLTVTSLNSSPVNSDWKNKQKTLSIADITSSGLTSFEAVGWNYINNTKFTVTELQILTLTEGDNIRIIEDESTTKLSGDIGNEFTPISSESSIKYTLSSSDATKGEQPLSSYSIPSVSWEIRSRLDIEAGDNLFQTLYDNQSVTFYYGDISSPTSIHIKGNNDANKAPSFTFDRYLNLVGGKGVSVLVLYFSDSGEENYVPEVNAFVLKSVSTTLYGDTEPLSSTLNAQNLYNVSLKGNSSLQFSTLLLPNKVELISIYYNKTSNETLQISSTLGSTSQPTSLIRVYNSGKEFSKTLTLDATGLYTIEVNTDYDMADTLILNFVTSGISDVTSSLLLSKPIISSGINSIFNLTSEQQTTLLSKINSLSNNLFFYNYTVLNSDNIDSSDFSSPYTLWSVNNIANKFTLAEIDFDTFNINIAKSSQL